MEQPLVSVVIPFYSEKEWLKEAVNSVLNQSYSNIEILVINDGSKEEITDLSVLNKANIKVIYKENGGPASARNMGIEEATGEYIAFLDSDDLWLPDKLSIQIQEMVLNKYVWSQHSYEMFWNDSNRTKIVDTSHYTGNVFKDCFISFKVQTSCVVVKRSIVLNDNIRFPIDKRYGQDSAFYIQIARNYPLGSIRGIYSKFRIRGQNAGFRAKVQLNYKAKTWEEIKKEQEIISILPVLIVSSFKVISLFSKFINYLEKKIIKSDSKIEKISKAFYFFPYLSFKLHARKR